LATGLLAFGAGLTLAVGSWLASRRVHNQLILNVLHCPMTFFDTTPTGRILNRCTKDVDVLDSTLPQNLRSFIWCTLVVLGTIGVVSWSTPAFLIIIILLGIVYFFVQVRPPYPSLHSPTPPGVHTFQLHTF